MRVNIFRISVRDFWTHVRFFPKYRFNRSIEFILIHNDTGFHFFFFKPHFFCFGVARRALLCVARGVRALCAHGRTRPRPSRADKTNNGGHSIHCSEQMWTNDKKHFRDLCLTVLISTNCLLKRNSKNVIRLLLLFPLYGMNLVKGFNYFSQGFPHILHIHSLVY